ncbi:DUF4010 domain-containing protein [Thiorhodococcus minor]|uniref:DUF4010 domain-containing protein n=1 Tax=Thiorhodococcus minor TaxID=57489 RepID=A0A6M0K3H9_9GAMM|nr:DUF4010 domain-containing protein [Thiorhodococcus minor]NEV64358.1 DUF4010 domain-containing protein [Thiorhodococcus minor]
MIPTAVISAVAASLLPGFKPQLHAWVENLDRTELQATLQLLLLALVILPILPNRNLGPGGIVNPYALWWLVVLIAGISYVGYFAVKILGPDKGIPITSFLGGLASSAATTVRLAKLASRQSADLQLVTAGVLIANATLAPRVPAICAAIDTELALRLTVPLLAISALIGLPALGFWLRRERLKHVAELQVDNPLALGLALRFRGAAHPGRGPDRKRTRELRRCRSPHRGEHRRSARRQCHHAVRRAHGRRIGAG